MKLRACNKHKEPLLFSATKQRNHTLMHVQLASYSIKKYCTFKYISLELPQYSCCSTSPAAGSIIYQSIQHNFLHDVEEYLYI